MKPVVRREYIEDKDKVERHEVTDIGDSEDSDQDEDQGEDEEEDEEEDNVEELFVSESDQSDQSAPIASSRNPDKFQVQVSFSIRFNLGNMSCVFPAPDGCQLSGPAHINVSVQCGCFTHSCHR